MNDEMMRNENYELTAEEMNTVAGGYFYDDNDLLSYERVSMVEFESRKCF